MSVALAVVPDVDDAVGTQHERPRHAARGFLLGGAITALALLLLGFVLHLTLLSRLSESRDQQVLRARFQEQVRGAVAPTALPLPRGAAVAVLQVPRIGLDVVVVEGTTGQDLALGPGHRTSTPLPGQPGVAVVAGRHSAYGGPFGRLVQLRVGDRITTTTGLGTSAFVVDAVRRDGRARPLAAADVRLELVTSDPAWTPTRALVVTARRVEGPTLAAPTGLPAPTASELALRGEPSAALPVVLWAAALLALSVLLTWAWQCLARPVVWVGGAPAVLAVLWPLADALTRLLPSTL